MTLHITPDMMEAAYELLRITPPFRRWKLPPADDVVFRVNGSKQIAGHFRLAPAPTFTLSDRLVRRLSTLFEVMAHEICHQHEDTTHGGRNDVQHSAKFCGFAKQVCKHHGFDEGTF